MAAGVVMCEPLGLYNHLNQGGRVSRLAEINYLCLIDARETQDYRRSHVATARAVKMDSEGAFLLPEAVEVDSMRHVVVYDGHTRSLREQGRAVDCALVLAKASLHPVHIVSGGFQRFSALYPFLTTEKILYTIRELQDLKTYPVEVLAGLLYMGDQRQATDASVLADLKIGAVVSISRDDAAESASVIKREPPMLHVPVADSGASDLHACFERICRFIDSQFCVGSRVLVVSTRGRSRCSAATVAFLMHHLNYTLKEAWNHMLECKPSMRPNTGFLQQLSEWELHTRGGKVTDVSECHFF